MSDNLLLFFQDPFSVLKWEMDHIQGFSKTEYLMTFHAIVLGYSVPDGIIIEIL